MAERRMFAKSIINSARFLRMPQSSRLLYYDLGMAADDDGIVEAFAVLRTTGAAEDDLKVLHAKNFVYVLNDDLVTYIVDWEKNNLIRNDRYHESIYKDLLNEYQSKNSGKPLVNHWLTEDSVGKDSLSKDSLGEYKEGEGKGRGNQTTSDHTQNARQDPVTDRARSIQRAWFDARSKRDVYAEVEYKKQLNRECNLDFNPDGEFIPLSK